MEYVWMIVIGAVIGAVARFLKPGEDSMGWIMTILFGIGGSVIASYLGGALGLYAKGGVMSFIASVIGAIVLLYVYQMVMKKK